MELFKWLTFLIVATASRCRALNVPLGVDCVMNVSSLLLQDVILPIGITSVIRDEGGSIASSAQLPPGNSFAKIRGHGNFVPQYVLDQDAPEGHFISYPSPPTPPGSVRPPSPSPPPSPPPPSPPPPRPPLPPGPYFTIIDFTQMATNPASSIISLDVGQDLTLASLSLYLVGIEDSLGTIANAQLSNLALSNKVISVPRNATLRLHDVTVIVQDDELTVFISNRFCFSATSWPFTPGVELKRDGLYISSLTTRAHDDQGTRGMGGIVEWRDVKVVPSGGGVYNYLSCAAFTVSDGSELLRISREVLPISFGYVYVSLTTNITLPPADDSWQPISLKGFLDGNPPTLVLLGNPNTTSTLDLAGRADVWVAQDIDWPESRLTAVKAVARVYDLTLVNLPYLSARPNGAMSLLASGLHTFTIRRGLISDITSSNSGAYLAVERCTLVVPDPELDFLEEALRDAIGAWPRGGFQSQSANDTTAIEGQLKVTSMQLMVAVQLIDCILQSASRYSTLPDSVQLLPQSRLWLPQLLAAKEEDTYRQLGLGGLEVFYGMDGALRDIQKFDSLLGYRVRLVSRRLDDSILGLSARDAPIYKIISWSVTVPTPQDSVSASTRIVVDSFPEEVLGGRVFVDLKGVLGRVQLARPITLQNLVLYNLAPGGMYPLAGHLAGEVAPQLTGVDAAWIGSTLPLWFFSLDRSAQDLAQEATSSVGGVPSTTTASSLASSSVLKLVNVTLVVPEPEWRALVAAMLWQHAPAAMQAAQMQQRNGDDSSPQTPKYGYGPPTGGSRLRQIVPHYGGNEAMENQQIKLRRGMAEQQRRQSSDRQRARPLIEQRNQPTPVGLHHLSKKSQRRTQEVFGAMLLPDIETYDLESVGVDIPQTDGPHSIDSPDLISDGGVVWITPLKVTQEPLSPPSNLPPPGRPGQPPPPPSPPYNTQILAALWAFANASQIRSYNFTSGVLVLDTATHYGWTGTNITITHAMPPDAPEGAVLLSYPKFELLYSELAADNINLSVQVSFPPPQPPPQPPISKLSPPTPFPPLLKAVRPNLAPSPYPSPPGPNNVPLNMPMPTLPTSDHIPTDVDERHTSRRPSWVVPLSATLSSAFGLLLAAVAAYVLLVIVRAHRKEGGSHDRASKGSQDGAGTSTDDMGMMCSSVSIRLKSFSAAVCRGKEHGGGSELGGLRHDAITSSTSELTPPVTGVNIADIALAPAITKATGYTQSTSVDSAAEDGTTACVECSTCAVPLESMPDAVAANNDAAPRASLQDTIPMASADNAGNRGGHQINVHQALAQWLESVTVSTLPPNSTSIGKGSRAWKGNRDAVARVIAVSLSGNTSMSTQLKPADANAKTDAGLAEVWKLDKTAAVPLGPQQPEGNTVFNRELQAYYRELIGHVQEKQPSTTTDMETTSETEVTPGAELPTDLQSRKAPDLDGLYAMRKSIRHLQAKLDDQGLEICSVIDMGAYGVVYRGNWRGLAVAVKTLVVAEGLGVSRQRAVLEAAISLSMAHPHVVATYAYDIKPLVQKPHLGPLQSTGGNLQLQEDLGSCDAFKLYIVQEYCNGGTLQQALERGMAGSIRAGGLPRVLALRFALDIALGLRHIHSCRIVHGDLKPENVLLSLDSMEEATETSLGPRNPMLPAITAKVADFGLSLPLRESATHASGQFHGTPAYLAPEVFASGKLSPSSDVWSLGLVLLELYYGCTLAEIVNIHVQLSGVPCSVPMQSIVDFLLQDMLSSPLRPFVALVAACLAQEPRARPTLDDVVSSLQGLHGNPQGGAHGYCC